MLFRTHSPPLTEGGCFSLCVITRFIRVIQFYVDPALDCRNKPGNDRGRHKHDTPTMLVLDKFSLSPPQTKVCHPGLDPGSIVNFNSHRLVRWIPASAGMTRREKRMALSPA